MNQPKNSIQSFFNTPQSERENSLTSYIESLSPEAIATLSTPEPEVQQIMERTLVSLLGGLPASNFEVAVTTDRESLGRLIASAMMNGYFLHRAHQRMAIEKSVMDASGSAQGDE